MTGMPVSAHSNNLSTLSIGRFNLLGMTEGHDKIDIGERITHSGGLADVFQRGLVSVSISIHHGHKVRTGAEIGPSPAQFHGRIALAVIDGYVVGNGLPVKNIC